MNVGEDDSWTTWKFSIDKLCPGHSQCNHYNLCHCLVRFMIHEPEEFITHQNIYCDVIKLKDIQECLNQLLI